jgi:hypothetical protein
LAISSEPAATAGASPGIEALSNFIVWQIQCWVQGWVKPLLSGAPDISNYCLSALIDMNMLNSHELRPSVS